MDWERLALEAAILIGLAVVILVAQRICCREKEEMLECPDCKGHSSFLTYSLHDVSKRICPECADREWENGPRAA